MNAACPSSPDTPAVSLDARLAFLRQPASYPDPSYRVEAIETHMSWVFLTDGFAYKLKKPVADDLLDFRTVEARRRACEEELRLNRRLAPDVYLGVVALSIDPLGHLRLGGSGSSDSGSVIDWLVRMRRLATGDMLDYAIRNGTAGSGDIRRVAARMARFYRECAPLAIDPEHYRAAFLHDLDRSQRQLVRAPYRLPAAHVLALCESLRAFLRDRRQCVDERVRAGRIVEGHGDLRPEHICLAPEVVVIDCLEFSRQLRIVDPADELGFLALECERLGAAPAGALLLQAYSEASGDWPDAALVHFYQGFRALLRARIAIRHLDEEKFRYSPQWRRRALDYLRLAQGHQDARSSVMEPPA